MIRLCECRITNCTSVEHKMRYIRFFLCDAAAVSVSFYQYSNKHFGWEHMFNYLLSERTEHTSNNKLCILIVYGFSYG